MTLTARQRTKINAALCLVHDNGGNANGIIQQANGLMDRGQDPRSAYEAAINDFLASDGALMPVISKVLKLVDASDDATVDQYDTALSAYVSTGDDSSLNELAPMIAEDSIALALRDGEITQEEADSGDIAKALGFEPGPGLQEAVASNGGQPSERAQEPQEQQPNQPAWQPRQQSAPPQLGAAPTATKNVNGRQTGAASAPTGMVAAGAAMNWARNTLQPLPNGAVEAPAIQTA